MGAGNELHPSFRHNHYLFRRKVFKLFGGAFHVYDKSGDLLMYSKQKAFKLREDFRVYADERQIEELLVIKTPQILDIGATYYVEDSTRCETVGAVRRKALASIFKDKWVFISADGQEIGELTETSVLGALLSRFVNVIPQRYKVSTLDGRPVAEIRQHFNPFVLKYTMTIPDAEPEIDRRLLMAANILLAGIEGRQQ
ncbi:MAG: hypothetical protein QF662_00160 [Phycisphaerae bacterium]|nr:hypothetical protein [Phycisphaerae bacterium]